MEHPPHQEIYQGDHQELNGQSCFQGLFLGLLGRIRPSGDSLSCFAEFDKDEGVAEDHESC